MVNSKYSPTSGMTKEVEGIVSVMTSKKTVNERRTEMQRVTFSPQSDGRSINYFPFIVLPKVFHVYFGTDNQKIYLGFVICPRSKF
ncbi:hypothetical protein E2320_016998 [Naja naja]|nr:hypothetical protein E2320_016998 [Naja naja]